MPYKRERTQTYVLLLELFNFRFEPNILCLKLVKSLAIGNLTAQGCILGIKQGKASHKDLNALANRCTSPAATLANVFT